MNRRRIIVRALAAWAVLRTMHAAADTAFAAGVRAGRTQAFADMLTHPASHGA